MSKILFEKTLIIGLGLIGGSFAKALRKNQLTAEIFAADFDHDTITSAKTTNAIDAEFNYLDLSKNELKNFDFIVLATPISAYKEILQNLAEKLTEKTLVIDLGSIKNLQNLKNILPENLQKNFIFCHPIAGSEKSGFKNSSSDLFIDKKFIICSENCDKNHLKKIEILAKEIGAIPDFIESKTHDEIYALVSHLPQFLSFLTKEFSPKDIKDEFFKTAFRLDDSDPKIWSDIFKLNEKNLEKFYLKFFANLEKFEEKIATAPKQALSHAELVEACLSLPFDSSAPELDKGSAQCAKTVTENFPAIFFRLLVVLSYLQIPEIKTFQSYAGSGFRDFTSITKILNFNPKKLEELLRKNRQKILLDLHKLKSN